MNLRLQGQYSLALVALTGLALAVFSGPPFWQFGRAEAKECLDGLITVEEQMIALVSAERILAPVAEHGTA